MTTFFVLIWIIGGCYVVQADDVTVITQYGSVLGSNLLLPNADGSIKSVRRFLGIPFASPPVGKLRFSAPEPPKPWKPSTYDARYWRNVCIQTDSYSNYIKLVWPKFTNANYTEDCLYLNVFTPGNSSRPGLFPVMVYIHGGAYIWGTPVFSPGDQLALRGVVVVTFQYRLGPFGFLSTGDSAAPGNFGMLDQVQALKWVQQNIEAFNGDPNKVTIFGLSAGSTSVALQLLSPLSKGLFHRAISESGVDLSPWAIHKTSTAALQTKSLAKKLACNARDSKSIVDCLRLKSASDLNMEGVAIFYENYRDADDIAWSPVVDQHFLPDTPQALREEGKFHKVDYIAGFTSHEGSMFLNSSLGLVDAGVSNVNAGVNAAVFKKFLEATGRRRTKDKRKAVLISDALEFEYTPWPDPSNPELLRQALVDFMTDHDYVAPTSAVLSAHSGHAPAFMYLFSHVSKLDKRPVWMGAKHGDSSLYIFGVPFWNDLMLFIFDESDKNVSHFMMNTWTNFAKTGNPTPEPVNGVTWNQFNSSSQAYLDIDGDSPKMAMNFRSRSVAFWNSYYPRLMDTKFEETRPCIHSLATRFVPSQGTLVASLIGLLVATSY